MRSDSNYGDIIEAVAGHGEARNREIGGVKNQELGAASA